jgi:hypothetical protein
MPSAATTIRCKRSRKLCILPRRPRNVPRRPASLLPPCGVSRVSSHRSLRRYLRPNEGVRDCQNRRASRWASASRPRPDAFSRRSVDRADSASPYPAGHRTRSSGGAAAHLAYPAVQQTTVLDGQAPRTDTGQHPHRLGLSGGLALDNGASHNFVFASKPPVNTSSLPSSRMCT